MSVDEKLSVGLLFDDSLDSNDGVAQQVKRLGEWLKNHGHNVAYLSGQTELKNWHGSPVYSLSKNFKVRFNGNRIGIPLWSKKRDMVAAFEKENFDIIHVTMPYSPMMAQRMVAIAAAKGVPVVGTFHILPAGILSRLGSRLLGLWQLFNTKKLSVVTAVSPVAAQFLKSSFGLDAKVIPNMVELTKFRTAKQTSQAKRVIFLGRLVPRKGCKQLIMAFAEVVKISPDAELVVAGDGPQRQELEKLAARLNLNNRIKFLGYINEADKAALLASARVACFPALSGESFGVVLIEAMAAGSGAVLGGDNPGYRSVLGEQADLLVDPNDTRRFAEQLNKLLVDDNLIAQMHNWQTKHVLKFDVDVVAPQILDIYRRVVAKR